MTTERRIKRNLAPCAAAILFAAMLAQGQTAPVTDEEKNLQAYVGLLRSDVRNAKSQVISEVMQFDAAQAAKFWPVYTEFEKEYTKCCESYSRHFHQFDQRWRTVCLSLPSLICFYGVKR